MMQRRPKSSARSLRSTRRSARRPCRRQSSRDLRVNRRNSYKQFSEEAATSRNDLSRLLAFVDIFVESSAMDDVVVALKKLDNLEELYEVTGEFDIVSLLSATDIEEFRDVLKNKIMKIKGVKSTVTSVVLMSHKGRTCDEDRQKKIALRQ